MADLLLGREKLPWWMWGGFGVWLGAAVMGALNSTNATLTVTADALRSVVLPAMLLPAAFTYLVDSRSRSLLARTFVAVAVLNAAVGCVQWALRPANPDAGYGLLGPGGANAAGFLALMG